MFKKVLIPIDVSAPDHSKSLLAAAKKLTSDWDCSLEVVTVIPDVGMAIVGSYFDTGFEKASTEAATTELSAMVSEAGVGAGQAVLSGRVYDAIIGHAEKVGADLILVGAHQPELSDYLLGANAAKIVRHARQSVMVLRGL